MKSRFWMFAGVAALLVAPIACAKGSSATPVSPSVDTAAALQSTTDSVKSDTYVCHHNVDGDDGDPEWVVINVSYKGWTKGHEGGHYSGDDFLSCIYEVGADCSSCLE
jgi:hypothetical protein